MHCKSYKSIVHNFICSASQNWSMKRFSRHSTEPIASMRHGLICERVIFQRLWYLLITKPCKLTFLKVFQEPIKQNYHHAFGGKHADITKGMLADMFTLSVIESACLKPLDLNLQPQSSSQSSEMPLLCPWKMIIQS